MRKVSRWLFACDRSQGGVSLCPNYVINSVDNDKLPCYTLPPTQHHSFLRNFLPLFLVIDFHFRVWLRLIFNLTFLRAYAPSQSRGRTKEIKWSLKILNKQNKKVTLFPQAVQLPWVWQAYLGPFDSVLAWEKMSRLEWMWNMECVTLIERFSTECSETKTKATTAANQKKGKYL